MNNLQSNKSSIVWNNLQYFTVQTKTVYSILFVHKQYIVITGTISSILSVQ